MLAAERMKEAAERIDSGVVFAVIGRAARGFAQIDANLPRFDDELRAQQGNITEAGEHEATVQLRAAWACTQGGLEPVELGAVQRVCG